MEQILLTFDGIKFYPYSVWMFDILVNDFRDGKPRFWAIFGVWGSRLDNGLVLETKRVMLACSKFWDLEICWHY